MENHIKKKTMGELYEKTKNRNHQLETVGYTVVEMWECKWVKSLEYRKSKNTGFVLPLKPREAFTGRHIEVFKLKVCNAKLKYIDVCSLYPCNTVSGCSVY